MSCRGNWNSPVKVVPVGSEKDIRRRLADIKTGSLENPRPPDHPDGTTASTRLNPLGIVVEIILKAKARDSINNLRGVIGFKEAGKYFTGATITDQKNFIPFATYARFRNDKWT